VFATVPPVVTALRTATLNTAPPAATVGHAAAVSVAVYATSPVVVLAANA
jgi:hypothetical protein